MKDLYKRLNVDEGAAAEAIRAALSADGIDPGERAAGEFVLLDPRRRAVYDRNRRVLVTIGQLRGRLALNLRPFWARADCRDFSQPFGPVPGRRSGRFDVNDDPAAMLRAFGPRRARPAGGADGWRRPINLALLIAIAALILIVVTAVLKVKE